jgi:hypothetical protein
MNTIGEDSPFLYKPYLKETVGRHRNFWTRRMPNEILVAIMAVDELPFIDPSAQCPDLGTMFGAWEHNFRLRQAIIDDRLPVARVSFGSAAFGAFLGAEITFELGIGWAYPFLDSYEKMDALRFDPDNEWIFRQRQACDYFLARAKGLFPLCEMEPSDGLNFVEAIRGSQAYLDVYDHPAELHRLLHLGSDFNVQFIDLQRSILAPNLYYDGGLFSMFWCWLPGEAPWMSIDAYGNCSPQIFQEFGAPYLQQMMDYYGGGWLHIHSHATHLLPEVVKMDKLLGIGVADDPNAPRGFDSLMAIRQVTGDIPLQIDCQAQELERGMNSRTLPGNTMYLVREGVQTVDQANHLVDQARAYRSVD